MFSFPSSGEYLVTEVHMSAVSGNNTDKTGETKKVKLGLGFTEYN